MIKKTAGERTFDVVNTFVLLIACIIALYPFLYVIFASFSDARQMSLYTGFLLKPLGFSLAAYKAVFKTAEIWTGYANTLFYVLVGTLYNLILTSLGAFVLSRKNFFWNRLILPMVVFTMFFSGGLIPNFILIKNLNLYDTRWALILPGAINTWNLFIMRTNFAAIPDSLEESAKIDGANDFVMLLRIILPLAKPVLAVMVLYYGVAHWNAWFSAMIYIRDRSKFPLQLFLREILMSDKTEEMQIGMAQTSADSQMVGETVKYATIIVATLPVLMVYPFLQKYFVKGMMIGAVKG